MKNKHDTFININEYRIDLLRIEAFFAHDGDLVICMKSGRSFDFPIKDESTPFLESLENMIIEARERLENDGHTAAEVKESRDSMYKAVSVGLVNRIRAGL